jgi:hypothetical protein
MAGIGQRLGNFKYAARPPKTFPPFPEAEPGRQRGDYRRLSPFEVLESRLLGHELSIGSDECAFGELAVENGHAARSATAPMPADLLGSHSPQSPSSAQSCCRSSARITFMGSTTQAGHVFGA